MLPRFATPTSRLRKGPAISTPTLSSEAGPAVTRPGATTAGRHLSAHRWGLVLAGMDSVSAFVAVAATIALWLGPAPSARLGGLSYWVLPVVVAPAWCLTLAAVGAYSGRSINSGVDEVRRVGNAVIWMLAALALSSYLLKADVSRGVVAGTLILLAVFTLTGHRLVRRVLRSRISRGAYLHRLVVVGLPADCERLTKHLIEARTGYHVVAVFPPSFHADGARHTHVLPDVRIAEAARQAGADTVAVCSIDALEPGELRRLSWAVEGTGLRLLAVPALTDMAGPRIVAWPLAGLPLLEIETPEFTGARRVVKDILDRGLALVLLVVTLPPLFLAALAIKLGDRGPVLYRQERIGRNGDSFAIWKLRSMRVGADLEHADLLRGADHSGVLFKVPRDPRVTLVGRFIRRFSIDELPQLGNVLLGSMSLVGPRPQRPDEVARYGDDARRRLLVKPGITGLWQVSGRSDLTWPEALRLDLYYVENWSVALDLLIIARTFGAVLRSRGAY